MTKRHGALSAFIVAAALLLLASASAACVAFMGKMEVEGHDGKTEVVGTGNSHAYCSTGRPTTAAAGHLADFVTAKVKPGVCNDPGAAGNHKMPAGTYEVRYNNELSYTFDGTHWNMLSGLGCFRLDNANTTSLLGTFQVDANGYGQWTGQIVTNGAPYYPAAGEAANFCVGSPALGPQPGTTGGPPGLLAPFRLLAI